MGHRTQITLTDAQYASLKVQSQRTGATLAELVRRAVSLMYGPDDGLDEEALDDSFGAWHDRDFDGAAYVEELRPGLGRRLGL
ncbi:MAG: ribbon-helix-helix domain-containing protein [Thermoleophilaceae bacterium]|nr:ribbon-helix-helix domain-containing protein [Thermoleophilaceae bacterium]MDQ3318776.1 ribbon-helix-helix domain-containing protein [Actinomycetota bacterium]MDQ3356542.1 ribbon-helix-helix domain-containing protein [Actinomycetota bacterium]